MGIMEKKMETTSSGLGFPKKLGFPFAQGGMISGFLSWFPEVGGTILFRVL